MKFSPNHQSDTAPPKGSPVRQTNVTPQIRGISNCPRVPPKEVTNFPKGEKKMCPAS